MLKLRFKNNKHNEVWLVEPKVTIGRVNTSDVVIEESGVNEQHAEILVKHEHLTLVNLSDKPLLINNRPVEKSSELKVNDVLRIGQIELEVVDPKMEIRPAANESTGWALKANHTALANRVYPIKSETVIGRSRECDISLAAAHLSRRHVKLFVQDGLLYLRDLGSANGTYLNGERVTEARVRRGDELRFDTLSFGVIGPPSEDLDKTTVRPMPSVAKKPAARPASSDKRLEQTQVIATARRGKAAEIAPQGAAARQVQDDAVEAPAVQPRVSALRWGALAVVGVGLALGVAWQQGWLGI